MIETKICTYYQDLLNAQYYVSEIFEHALTRGEIREEFLKEIFLKRNNSLQIYSGMLFSGAAQSGQCDLLITKTGVPISPFGSKIAMDVRHCKIVLEVKSNAKGSDFRDCNEKAEKIKSLNLQHVPKYGMFCYNYALTKETVMKRFGFQYDKDLEEFAEDENLALMYPHIDFIVSIQKTDGYNVDEFFLMKDSIKGRYNRIPDYPVVKTLFNLVDNI
ncbi:MAG: hypothetical protein KKD05_06545 [Candidatus Omnitrophica bacterium]|nr:hypothetical protein [Candidatus Omnitrophota bacterium]